MSFVIDFETFIIYHFYGKYVYLYTWFRVIFKCLQCQVILFAYSYYLFFFLIPINVSNQPDKKVFKEYDSNDHRYRAKEEYIAKRLESFSCIQEYNSAMHWQPTPMFVYRWNTLSPRLSWYNYIVCNLILNPSMNFHLIIIIIIAHDAKTRWKFYLFFLTITREILSTT